MAVVSLSKISRSQIFVKMHEVIRNFDIRYENGCFFFIRFLAKVLRESSKRKNEKQKTSAFSARKT